MFEHRRAIEALGGTAKTESVFTSLRNHFGDRLRLHCGYVGGELASALPTIRYLSTVEYIVQRIEMLKFCLI